MVLIACRAVSFWMRFGWWLVVVTASYSAIGECGEEALEELKKRNGDFGVKWCGGERVY